MSERYADPFLNALMYPHQVVARGELYFANAKVGEVEFLTGTVTANRGGTVRRMFSGSVDPRLAPVGFGNKLSPYGSQLVVYRGIRYPNGTVEEVPVFTGRIDSVDFGRTRVEVTASDRGADIVDARFLSPVQSTRGLAITTQIANLIRDAIPGAVVNDRTGNGGASVIGSQATWDRERTEALDNLAQSVGWEWYAGPDGEFYIDPLPSIVVNPVVKWIVDSGDTGVTIERQNQTDRARIYNAVVVNGEPPDGRPPAYGVALDNDPESPLYFGGPFGKVPKFFSSQFITTNAQAQNTAVAMLGDCVCGTRSITVTCVPNPKLGLSDIIDVRTDGGDFDGLYFVSSFSLPLGPEVPMTLGCNVTLTEDAGFLRHVKRGVTP